MSRKSFYFGGGLTETYSLRQTAGFCQQADFTNFVSDFCAILPIDFFPKLWYNDYRK